MIKLHALISKHKLEEDYASLLREGLIQSLPQCLLPVLRAWVEVGGIALFPCLKAFLPQPIPT